MRSPCCTELAAHTGVNSLQRLALQADMLRDLDAMTSDPGAAKKVLQQYGGAPLRNFHLRKLVTSHDMHACRERSISCADYASMHTCLPFFQHQLCCMQPCGPACSAHALQASWDCAPLSSRHHRARSRPHCSNPTARRAQRAAAHIHLCFLRLRQVRTAR